MSNPPVTPDVPPSSAASDARQFVSAAGELPPLVADLASLQPRVQAAADRVAASAGAEFDALPDVAGAKAVLPAFARAWQQIAATRAQNAERRDLSAAGLRAVDEAAKAAHDAEVVRLTGVLAGYCDRLVARFPAPSFPAPTIEVASEVQLIFVKFPVLTAATFAAEALATLRRALTAPGAAEQFRANQLLFHAYGPLLLRRAAYPEGFARPFAAFAAELGGVVATHLDVVLEAASHRMAGEFAEDVRGRFAAFAAWAVSSHWSADALAAASLANSWPATNAR